MCLGKKKPYHSHLSGQRWLTVERVDQGVDLRVSMRLVVCVTGGGSVEGVRLIGLLIVCGRGQSPRPCLHETRKDGTQGDAPGSGLSVTPHLDVCTVPFTSYSYVC